MVRSSRHTQYGQEEAGGQREWKQLVRARSCIPGGDRWLFLTSWSKPGAAALAACTAVRNGASAFARPVKSLAASPAAKSYPPLTPGSACWRLVAGSSPPPISSAFKKNGYETQHRASCLVGICEYILGHHLDQLFPDNFFTTENVRLDASTAGGEFELARAGRAVIAIRPATPRWRPVHHPAGCCPCCPCRGGPPRRPRPSAYLSCWPPPAGARGVLHFSEP